MGLVARELMEVGAVARELMEVGPVARELIEVGPVARELMKVGPVARELIEVGYCRGHLSIFFCYSCFSKRTNGFKLLVLMSLHHSLTPSSLPLSLSLHSCYL